MWLNNDIRTIANPSGPFHYGAIVTNRIPDRKVRHDMKSFSKNSSKIGHYPNMTRYVYSLAEFRFPDQMGDSAICRRGDNFVPVCLLHASWIKIAAPLIMAEAELVPLKS